VKIREIRQVPLNTEQLAGADQGTQKSSSLRENKVPGLRSQGFSALSKKDLEKPLISGLGLFTIIGSRKCCAERSGRDGESYHGKRMLASPARFYDLLFLES